MFFEEWVPVLREVNFISTLLRLSLAAICGGTIGMERGRRRRAAGLRTHMLVCIGSALVMITNQYIVSEFGGADPARLGAQVISGIGFLGVGTIIVDRQHQVRGLTTAAGLWACACMGLALGIGFYSGALIAYVFILSTVIILNKFGQHILGKSRIMEVYTEFEEQEDITRFVNLMYQNEIRIEHLEIVKPRGTQKEVDSRVAVTMILELPKRYQHTQALAELDSVPGLLIIEEVH